MKALRIPDGTVEALKWLALVLMTGDHVNKYLFNATLPVLFEAGRVALPLFVFVLAYNLARPGTLERGVYGRTMSRLAMFGALASVPFVALGGLYAGWWPLNVMFTLLVVTATAYLVERGGKLHLAAAGVVFLVGGSSVEYWWPAVAFGLAVWSYTRRPSWSAAAVAVLACGLDRFYPQANAGLFRRILDDGALVSELPPGCAPYRQRFLARNRLIAALGVGTVVVEASLRSGSLSTAGRAFELGRHVAMVPGPVTSAASAGCHEWLRTKPVSLVTDVTAGSRPRTPPTA